MLKAKGSRDIQEKKKKFRTIANFMKTYGAILLKLAGYIEVIEAFKTCHYFFAPMQFEGATTQILTKKRHGRTGKTNNGHHW